MKETEVTRVSHLTSECGSHCGVKDGIVGHCKCNACHDGKPPSTGRGWRYSTKGKVLPKNFRGDGV